MSINVKWHSLFSFQNKQIDLTHFLQFFTIFQDLPAPMKMQEPNQLFLSMQLDMGSQLFSLIQAQEESKLKDKMIHMILEVEQVSI